MEKKHRWVRWCAVGAAVVILLSFAVPPAVKAVSNFSNKGLSKLLLESVQSILEQASHIHQDQFLNFLSESSLESDVSEVESLPEAPSVSIAPEEAAELDKLIASYGGGVSVYYKSLTREDTYSYADDTEYYIASVVKAPYALYVYQLADEGEVDLSQMYTYQYRHRQGGASYLQTQKVGTQYTLAQLLEYTIRYSDNNAFMMVREAVSVDGFKQFVRTLGLDKENSMDTLDDGGAIHGNISAHDAGIIAEAIYNYAEGDSPNGKKLKEDLLHTEQSMLRSQYPIARKLGSWDDAMHDVAIIYAPEPYVLAVCTNRGHSYDSWYTDADYDIFIQISALIEKFSQN